MNKFQVFGDKVLILPDSTESMSPGGIIIPPNAQSKTYWGTVINTGSSVGSICDGDHVFYDKYAGTPIGIDGKEYIIVKQSDVLGRLLTESKE